MDILCSSYQPQGIGLINYQMVFAFTATFRAKKNLKNQYLDEYKLQYLFNKKQRISKENAIHMSITHSVNLRLTERKLTQLIETES